MNFFNRLKMFFVRIGKLEVPKPITRGQFGTIVYIRPLKNETPNFEESAFSSEFDLPIFEDYELDEDTITKLLRMSSTRGYIEEASGIAHRDWNKISTFIASKMPWEVFNATSAYRDVPIALYIDFSLSNYKISHALAYLATVLLKKDTMLYLGENGDVERYMIVDNQKILPQDISGKGAFEVLSEGEFDGLKAEANDGLSLAALIKKYHNRKVWICSDFHIYTALEEISPSVKITWFCMEKINFECKHIALQDNIMDVLRYNTEIIALSKISDLLSYANGNGKEMSDKAKDRGLLS